MQLVGVVGFEPTKPPGPKPGALARLSYTPTNCMDLTALPLSGLPDRNRACDIGRSYFYTATRGGCGRIARAGRAGTHAGAGARLAAWAAMCAFLFMRVFIQRVRFGCQLVFSDHFNLIATPGVSSSISVIDRIYRLSAKA